MAPQLGAICFVSAPGFAALKEGGDLKWLTHEFGIPLGLLLVIIVILLIRHRGNYIWLWWNLAGFAVTVAVASGLTLVQIGRRKLPALADRAYSGSESMKTPTSVVGSVATFFS